jgi:hypothetical protein
VRPARLAIGDVLTLRGVTAGLLVPGKPLKRWRVAAFADASDVILQPLNDDGSVDEFTDACSEYRFTVDAETPHTMN